MVAAVICTAWVIIAGYDFNRLKPDIESAFEQTTGGKLTLSGSLRLEIGLTPALVVNDALLQNSPWGSRPAMAEIKRREVRVCPFPLVFGKVNVKRVILVNPDILIETSLEGSRISIFWTKSELRAQRRRAQKKRR